MTSQAVGANSHEASATISFAVPLKTALASTNTIYVSKEVESRRKVRRQRCLSDGKAGMTSAYTRQKNQTSVEAR